MMGVDVSKAKHDTCMDNQFAGQQVFEAIISFFLCYLGEYNPLIS